VKGVGSPESFVLAPAGFRVSPSAVW